MKKLSLWLTCLLFIATSLIATPSKGFPQYNWILGGAGTANCTVNIPNDVSTGTTLNQFVKLTTAGAVVNASTTDTTRIVGVVTANAGTTGSASVQVCGIALVNFDGGVTAANFVIASTTAGGKGHDSGSNSPSSTVQNLGQIVSPTTGGAGQYFVLLANLYPSAGGGGSVTSVALAMPGIFSVAGSPITGSGTITVTLGSQSQNLVFASPNGSSGTPTFRAIACGDQPALTGDATSSAGSCATTVSAIDGVAIAPISNNSASGSISLNMAANRVFRLTLTGNVTSMTCSNPVSGITYEIKTKQGAGPYTVSWCSQIDWGAAGAPTLSSSSGQWDVFNCSYDSTGTVLNCAVAGKGFSN